MSARARTTETAAMEAAVKKPVTASRALARTALEKPATAMAALEKPATARAALEKPATARAALEKPALVTALAAALLGTTGCESHEVPDADPAPIRYDVALGDAPTLGPEDAPVVMVEFGDFQCSACASAEATVDLLLEHYDDGQLRFAWKHFPLSFHAFAFQAAEAAAAAGAQGAFWPYHDLLFEHRTQLDRASLEGYAEDLGLDLDVFRADLDARAYEPVVQADVDQGTEIHVPGTPTFFINGRRVFGAAPYQELAAIIDQELAAAGDAGPRPDGASGQTAPDARR